MEQSILTKEQKKLLESFSKDKFITNQFFLTGGTALSEFYFKHRLSEDLDFFSEQEFNPQKLLTSIAQVSKKLKIKKIEQQTLTGQEVFYFYIDKNMVKIDFSFFPFAHLGTFKKFRKLKVSSLEDICINKIHAISTRKRARDFIDLYFCLKKLGWDENDIIKNYKLKFDISLPLEQLATSYTNVLDAQDLPIFLGNTDWGEVKTYFLKLTKNLKSKIVK